MRRILAAVGVAASVWLCAGAAAQAPSPPPVEAAPPAPPAAAIAAPQTVRLHAGFPIRVELLAALSSMTSKSGEAVPLKLAAPIVVDGREIVAAGALGVGEVVDAGPARMGGQQGKLQVSARTLTLNGVTVRIRGMNMLQSGQGLVGASTAASIFISPLASIVIRGGDITIGAGTLADAKIAVDVDIPVSAPAPQPQPAQAAGTEPAQPISEEKKT